MHAQLNRFQLSSRMSSRPISLDTSVKSFFGVQASGMFSMCLLMNFLKRTKQIKSLNLNNLKKKVYLRVHFLGKSQNGSLFQDHFGSPCIKGTEKSFPRVDSSVALMQRDSSDHGSKICFQIFPPKSTLRCYTLPKMQNTFRYPNKQGKINRILKILNIGFTGK